MVDYKNGRPPNISDFQWYEQSGVTPFWYEYRSYVNGSTLVRYLIEPKAKFDVAEWMRGSVDFIRVYMRSETDFIRACTRGKLI